MARGTAQLVVQFVGDASKLTSEVGKVQAAGGRLKGFAAKAGSAIAAGFAVGAVVDFGKASITAAQEAEVATNRLKTVFAAMGDETGNAARAAEEYASALSKQIGVEDETIMAAQAKLATFSAVSNEASRQAGIFDRTTAAAADLAAAGFGTMESNATALGKAMQDPARGLTALSRSGVTFTAQQKEQIAAMTAAGDTLGANQVILAAVEGQVQGTAAATATNAQKMSVAWGEVQEQIGTALLPAFQSLTSILLGSVIPALQSTIAFVSENVSWLAPLAAVILTVVAGLKAWAIAQAILNAVMAVNPIVLIVVAIAALVAGLVVAYQKVDWFRAAVDTAFAAVAVAFGWIKTAALAVFNWLASNWKTVLTIVAGPIGIAVRLVIAHWDKIKSVTAVLVSVVSAYFRAIATVIRSAVSGVGAAARQIGAFFASIGRAAKSVFDTVARWFGAIVDRISGVVSGISSAVSSIVSAIKGPINAVLRAWNGLRVPGFDFHIDPPGPGPTISFSWAGIDLPNIPLLQRGGLLTSPTLFVGGEAGTEIVSPESTMRRIVREETGGLPIVGQLNVSAWDPVSVARAVANELAYLQVRQRP